MAANPLGAPLERPPQRIWLHDLREILAWYEQNLCAVELRDPQDHVVRFSLERFPHFIKLEPKGGGELKKPRKQVEAIKSSTKSNADFGGYSADRVQTLPWVTAIIARPTKILELASQPLIGDKKAGDTLYVKEFQRIGPKYRFKVLVCKRISNTLLVPITCHPRDHDRFTNYRQIWP
jgi:hypothetical protein